MKQTAFVAAALVAGFVGGVLGERLAYTRRRVQPEQIVRARSFELVDETGRAISYWGIDSRNYAVLAFGSYWPPDKTGRGGQHPTLPLDDPNNQRATIGVIADSPFLEYKAPDGKTRMSLGLSIYEKPLLWMADETGHRLWLGNPQSDTPGPNDNNWILSFEPDRAWMGMFTVDEGGQKYVRGTFGVNRDKVKYPYPLPK